jgi:hypothetical protein
LVFLHVEELWWKRLGLSLGNMMYLCTSVSLDTICISLATGSECWRHSLVPLFRHRLCQPLVIGPIQRSCCTTTWIPHHPTKWVPGFGSCLAVAEEDRRLWSLHLFASGMCPFQLGVNCHLYTFRIQNAALMGVRIPNGRNAAHRGCSFLFLCSRLTLC